MSPQRLNILFLLYFVDVDECEGTAGCSQGCVNEDGGFRCTCRQGYTLAVDGRTCNGW